MKRLFRHPQVLLGLLVVVVLTPFLFRPFHMDDTFWVWTAKQIVRDPLNFYGYNANWYGTQQWMYEITKTPPLFAYALAFGGMLLGWTEPLLHLTVLPWSIAFALGIYSLAREVSDDSFLIAFILLLTPVFVLSGVSVMCDTAMAALWIWSLHTWMQACRRKKHALWFLSGVLCGLSCLTKYNGLTLLPLLFLYSLLKERRLTTQMLYLLVPISMIAGYRLVSQTLYGKDLFAQTVDFTLSMPQPTIAALVKKTFIGLSFLGGTCAPLLFFSPLLWARKTWFAWAGLFLALMWFIPGDSFLFGAQSALWGVVGIKFLALSVLDLRNRRDPFSVCLFAWVCGTFFFAAYLNWSITARAFITIAPALGFLLVRRLRDRYESIPVFNWRMILPSFVSLAFVLSLCHADFQQAVSVRRSVNFVLDKYPPSQNAVWFQGHWGFQYYMEAAGAKPADFLRPEWRSGDIMVIPVNNTNLRRLEGIQLVGTLEGPVASYIAIMNNQAQAGYYSDKWGILPFRLFFVPLEIIQIYRVS